jgi:hypothetical protein
MTTTGKAEAACQSNYRALASRAFPDYRILRTCLGLCVTAKEFFNVEFWLERLPRLIETQPEFSHRFIGVTLEVVRTPYVLDKLSFDRTREQTYCKIRYLNT